ncbi:helix-turn-helix domain-containing protein [Sporobacter termitidis]|uniref:helix-turn-helix domain-containing protein n=1 Tax=Sporobacter termitidis TaxID=44749 RepID=UPI0009350D05|nr:helix-turn-helix domain-containing protein [Sporobacter termitidis]
MKKEFDQERLQGIERILLDPDILVQFAMALKEEREARIQAESKLNQLLNEKQESSPIEKRDSTKNEVSASKPNLKVSEAAKELGVSMKTLYRRIAEGELKAQRLSPTCLRIETSDFVAFKNGLKERKPYTRKK